MVPVTRMDLSGYGECLFSDWRNPYTDPVAVVQARFDVMIGRTAHEVIQVRSVLFPYGVVVVRTITIERRNNAIVTRSDSGWKAVGDGVYQFPGSPIVTHPGVVTRITDVVNILDTGQVVNVGGDDWLLSTSTATSSSTAPRPTLTAAPVSPRRSTSSASSRSPPTGGLIGPNQYADLINQAGALGGPLDTSIKHRLGHPGHASPECRRRRHTGNGRPGVRHDRVGSAGLPRGRPMVGGGNRQPHISANDRFAGPGRSTHPRRRRRHAPFAVLPVSLR